MNFPSDQNLKKKRAKNGKKMQRRRLQNEFRLQRACHPWTLDESGVVCDALNILIRCPPTYPFAAPKLEGVTHVGTVDSTWVWFAVCARRASNRVYFPKPGTCTCCTSPLCSWHPRTRICDIVDYAACLRDVRVARTVCMPARLALPLDLLELIVEHCW